MRRPIRWPRRVVYSLFAIAIVLGVIEWGLSVGGVFLMHRWADIDRAAGLRILCVGDSYTYGIGTDPKRFSYPSQLSRLSEALNPGCAVSVFNAAVPGQDSGEVLAELPQLLEDIEPQIVCVLVGANNASGEFQSVVSGIDLGQWRTYRVLHLAISRLRYGRAGGEEGRSVYSQPDRQWSHPWGEPRDLVGDLQGIRSVIESRGATMVIATYPHRADELSPVLLGFSSATGVPLVDLNAIFLSVVDDMGGWEAADIISLDGAHPNGRGYGLAAQAFYDVIQDVSIWLRTPVALKHRSPGWRLVDPVYSVDFSSEIQMVGPSDEGEPPLKTVNRAMALAESGADEAALKMLRDMPSPPLEDPTGDHVSGLIYWRVLHRLETGDAPRPDSAGEGAYFRHGDAGGG